MAAVNVSLFRGMSKKISPRLLPEDMAVSCINVDLDAGSLRPIKGLSTSVTLPSVQGGVGTASYSGSTKTFFQSRDNVWFTFSGSSASVIDGPVAEDAYKRVYFSNSVGAYVASTVSGSAFTNYLLGVPALPTAPSSAQIPVVSATTDTETAVSRSYVVTCVTAWGEEGPPSPPSAILDTRSDQAVTVSLTALPANINNRNIVYYRVYRTDANGVFRYAFQVSALSATSTTDTVLESALGEELVSQEWDQPPQLTLTDYGLSGICSLPNGITAGFTGQTVCFSESFLPHAWPKRYQLTTQAKIIALTPLETGLLVMTEGQPYIVQGSDPAGMVMTELNVPYPIANAESAVNVGGSVIYCSQDGLVSVSSAGAALVTETIFTRTDWQAAHSPATVQGFEWEGKYVGFHTTSGAINGFIFDPRGGKSAFTALELDDSVTAAFSSSQNNELYVITNGTVKKFAQGSHLRCTWLSRHYFSDRAINMGVAQIAFGENLGQVSVVTDGAGAHLNDTVILFSASENTDVFALADVRHIEYRAAGGDGIHTFRLPSGYKSHVSSFQISTKEEVHSITMAESPAELR